MGMLYDVMHIMHECFTKMCLLILTVSTSSEIAKYICVLVRTCVF